MCKRKRCRNKDCSILFIPCRQVPEQEFCSRKECQLARKRDWNRKKHVSDPDYKEARKEAQERWKDKNPNYWQEYRVTHPEYIQKNRKQQQLRNQKRRQNLPVDKIVKTDESIPIKNGLTGRYKITPVRADMIVKTDEYIVEIVAIPDR